MYINIIYILVSNVAYVTMIWTEDIGKFVLGGMTPITITQNALLLTFTQMTE